MNLIVVYRNNSSESSGGKYLRFALTSNPIANIVMEGFKKYSIDKNTNGSFLHLLKKTEVFCAIAKDWPVPPCRSAKKDNIITYEDNIPIPSQIIKSCNQNKNKNMWISISNGRFITKISKNLLEKVLDQVSADIVSINVEPGLLSGREKVRLTAQGEIAGFRRQYSDSARLCPVPDDWPAHLFVRNGVFTKLLNDNSLTLSFSEVMAKCSKHDLSVCAVNVGGTILDLDRESGLLALSRTMLMKKNLTGSENEDSIKIPDSSRLAGKVLFGKNVQIGPETIIAGPAVIGDNVVIEEGSVINSSIIGTDILIHRDQPVQNRIIVEEQEQLHSNTNENAAKSSCLNSLEGSKSRFRNWPKLSYARFFKRLADIFTALIVLTLFAPLIPFIAAAIKLTSPGSVFYKDKRQGLHGKEFNCLKFRTMIAGANKIQENLRFVSQVDGPQFKMDNDPRISMVGRFLRETYIDEIPQFFNVLFGQMSVVGPRPSPESENTLCPFWRDARLSVRPGITGLWQVCRTRMPMKDFQEWIRYDTEYVKNLSLKTDLEICCKTAKQLIDNFISQF